jgi:predicted transcriptional regulator
VRVPKRLELRVTTPPDVYAATQAFGSELRLHLIRYFAASPGRQVDAVRALGVERAVVSLNVRALVDTGVLVAEGGHRSRVFRINGERLEHLVSVLKEFTDLES